MQKTNKLIICAAGIFVCYFYFGILQEKITRGKYGEEEKDADGNIIKPTEKYTYMLALVCAQCVVNYLFAKGMLTAWHLGEDKTPQVYCASAAITYLLAMVCSYMALQWVAFPTQVTSYIHNKLIRCYVRHFHYFLHNKTYFAQFFYINLI